MTESPGRTKALLIRVERLLAAAGDEEIFVFRGNAVAAEEFEQSFFEGRVAVAGAEREDVAGFAAEDGVDAVHQLIDREKFGGGARHDERESVFGGGGGEAAQGFVAAFVGEEEFPADTVVAV